MFISVMDSFVSVPPSESKLLSSKPNPLSVGDFLNLTCSTDSSNPPASLAFDALDITDFQLSANVASVGNYNGLMVAKSLSGRIRKSHNGKKIKMPYFVQ